MREGVKNKTVSIIDGIALFFFAALAFFLPISNAAVESIFGFIFLCFIAKAVILRPSWHKIRAFFTDRVNLSLLAFYIAIGISIFAAGPLWAKSLKAWFFKWGEGVLLFYFGQFFINRFRLRMVIIMLCAVTFLLCIDSFYQLYYGKDFLRGFAMTHTPQFDAIRASFNHYNDFAAFLVVMIFVVSGVLFSSDKPIKVLAVLLIAISFVCLLLTHSRAAWISLLAISFYLCGFMRVQKQKKKIFFIILILFLISLALIPFSRQRLMFTFSQKGDADRLKVWSMAWVMFKESPIIGKGLGLFMELFPKYNIHRLFLQYAHNCYLQILAETGIVGLIFFLCFLWQLGRRCYLRLWRKDDYMALGLFGGWLAFLIHMFFDTQLYSLRLSVFFWLIASMLFIISKDNGVVNSLGKLGNKKNL